MQNLANRLPDSFTDPKRVTKSHVLAINAPIRIDIQEGQSTESKTRLKRGRPIGSKDKNPRKRKGTKHQDNEIEEIVTQDEFPDISDKGGPEEPQVPDNYDNEEISINYVISGERWNRNAINIDDNFVYNVALHVINDDDDIEPKSDDDCKRRNYWPKWKEAIEAELNSLDKRKVFGPIVHTPDGIKPVGYKWVFVRKRNENNEIVRYKARLVV